MPIEMPRGLPFSVDTWNPISKRKRHHFLTHAHKDHSTSISTHSSYPIYSTLLTKSLVLLNYPQLDDSLFVNIEVGQSLVIGDPDGEFTVTAFDANHCPGAVMFLFEGNFGNILHTGDCRLTPECLRYLPEKYISKKGKQPSCLLDYVFLDCTFGKFAQKLPSKHTAIRQVINCIWKHPAAAVVYLTCDLLGQEDILVNVAQTFGSKIFIDKNGNPECFQALTLIVPEILTQDPSSRFHMFDGFPKVCERAAAKLAEAQASNQPEPLIIRPSAQWYACDEELSDTESRRKLKFSEAVKDPFGIWHVCYSMHSSRQELEWALQLLTPKRVVSTTPSCLALELDYVKKNCFGTRLTSDDPLWRLLDISVEASSGADTSVRNVKCSVIDDPIQISAESQLLPVKVSPSKLPCLSSPSKRPTVTLFGKARLGIQDSNLPTQENLAWIKEESLKAVAQKINQDAVVLFEVDTQVKYEKKTAFTKGSSPKDAAGKINQDEVIPLEADGEVKCENKLGIRVDGVVCSEENENLEKKEVSKVSPIGSSKCFSENLRRLYRSMNVPVPRPLPSLVELKGTSKQTKRRFEF